MKLFSLLMGAFLTLAVPGAASTIGYTEGKRDRVDGTERLAGRDASSRGFILGTVGNGDSDFSKIGIFGRIVGHADYFTFRANSNFNIAFIYSGLTFRSSPITSGFVQEGQFANEADFVLRDVDDPSSEQRRRLRTDLTSTTGPGAGPVIFSGQAGKNYIFGVDSRVADDTGAARYDVVITAIPLPAGILLLAGGLAGLGYFGRRKS
ncbi:VPLPA-CTERM sorting domain-containing protein [Roseobacter sp. S98]|uniref:VPLPA-CTERM sorting domain-containing protein n=1 Tax=Roseobacter algicola (ex Choi et al. 2025) (nom. illeg.) TaxID=3092138 RepID=UPI0035C7775E